ncbi:MAG TPA: copper chaperone PCu(A)C [Ignavibacteriaceae bacterium]|nr:copper chaperone PCu(A)C [Ignavibacteriaceae bacterium]
MYLLIFVLSLLFLQQEQLQIENAWIRPSSKGMNSALYFDVKNNGDDPLTLYKVESDVAKLVQIHETYKNGDKMGMRKVESVTIKPKSTFKFKPGRHHVMLIRVKEDLKVGSEYDAAFFFKNLPEIKIKVPVKRAN